MFYPDLGKMSTWGREKFLSATNSWSLTIRNHRLTSIIDCGLHFLGHLYDQDLTLNFKDHINLYKRKNESFKLSSCMLRCIQIGVLQVAIELRNQNLDMSIGPKCGVTSDTLRDCISAPGKFHSIIVFALLTISRFGEKQFSVVEKFARRGWNISREQITAAVIRCNEAISSHRRLKCSLEIALSSMKSEYHFAT